MGAVYKKPGRVIDYTPTSAVTAEDVIVIGDLVCVATDDIAANQLGALAVEGIFDFPKATTSTSAISAGAKVYWDASGEVVTTSAAGGTNKYVGKTVAAATATATTARVRLEQ